MTASQQDPLTHREIETLNQSIRDLSGSIERLREQMENTYVRKDVLEPQLKEMRKDIDGHSAIFVWGARIIVGVVLVALLALVIKSGGVVPS